ncbi:monovalent cation/H(+) antiporter subunit G [Alteribacillus iranensis]|uniref:Multisubunit sodium/proton antiporter, MrpG subunit n=1 Tax=Alteribacillus iranensis TaxID=930128 RepID=A0A1I1Z9R7_9BACI|nr:monovalent cation/H(+) antiporter subunit G [Alteribacillus iranensis]SFE28048.1 multisubunit sodium/proton antiporter, MrpG subunit [Alteribacillus iranensis]
MIGVLVLIGALLSLISAIGVIRLPDVYTRLHASTKAATLGVMCILLALFLFFGLVDGYVSARILLAILFVFATAPVGGHLISRAAHNTGVSLWESSTQDDLRKKKTKKDLS